MFRSPLCLIAMFLASSSTAMAKDITLSLPSGVAELARSLDRECTVSGHGNVILSENYGMAGRGPGDLNSDGKPEHIVYNCMFGCSEKPMAFTGTGTPCPHGNLLMSTATGYEKLFLPGVVNKVYEAEPVTLAISRPRTLRLHGNYCETPQINHDPQYLYNLRDGRFQLVAMCPETGCQSLVSKSTADVLN